MKYKNIEIQNVAEISENPDGSVSWLRVPAKVYEAMELSTKNSAVRGCTGVELRFVIRGDRATIRMSSGSKNPKSSKRVKSGKKIAIGGSITATTQKRHRKTPQISISDMI